MHSRPLLLGQPQIYLRPKAKGWFVAACDSLDCAWATQAIYHSQQLKPGWHGDTMAAPRAYTALVVVSGSTAAARLAGIMMQRHQPGVAGHHENCQYYQSTSQAHSKVRKISWCRGPMIGLAHGRDSVLNASSAAAGVTPLRT